MAHDGNAPADAKLERDQRDREFIKRIAAKDAGADEAMQLLMKAHRPSLVRYFSRLRYPAEHIENVIDETFLKIFEKADTYRGESTVKTWLFKIAINENRMSLRAHAARKNDSGIHDSLTNQMSDELVAEGPDPLQRFLEHERTARLKKAIQGLIKGFNSKKKTVIEGILAGRSTDDIAAQMNVKPSAVRKHLHEIRGILRERLDGGSSSMLER